MSGTRTPSPRPTPISGGIIEECVVVSIGPGGVTFTRPDLDKSKHTFGPIPYTWPVAGVTGPGGTGPHTHTIPVPANQPVAGDRLLVVWVGADWSRGWAIGWAPK
jgi:hypothetical protein